MINMADNLNLLCRIITTIHFYNICGIAFFSKTQGIAMSDNYLSILLAYIYKLLHSRAVSRLSRLSNSLSRDRSDLTFPGPALRQ